MADTTAGTAGQGDRLMRIDMGMQSVSIEPFPEKWRLLGGRALSARVLLEECDARTMEAKEMEPGTRDEGGQALQEF